MTKEVVRRLEGVLMHSVIPRAECFEAIAATAAPHPALALPSRNSATRIFVAEPLDEDTRNEALQARTALAQS
jgi:hypothetical protein